MIFIGNLHDPRHPNIVKLDTWPPQFVPEQFYDRVVKLITKNPDASTADVFHQLLEIIDSPSNDTLSNGTISQSVAL